MRKSYSLVISLLLSLLILSNCGPGPFDPTPTPTNTPSLTPTNCPLVILDRTPAPPTIRPYLILVLFEDAYQPQNNQDVEMLRNLFREHAEPGDYVLMMKMEPLTLEAATFFQGKLDLISPPPIPPVPTKYPTFTPIPPPATTPDTTIAQTAQVNHITETVTASAPTATYQAFEHQCAMKIWKGEFLEIETNYQDEKQRIKDGFADTLTPFSGDPISRTAVWHGLEMATLVLKNECSNYQRCILLIFSDMDEVNLKPTTSTIYLPLPDGNNDKLEILVTMRNCLFMFTGSCGKWKNFWENFFSSQSISAEFVNGNSEEAIESILKR